MKKSRRVTLLPVRLEANLIGNHKSMLTFVSQTPGSVVNYAVALDNSVLLDMMDALKRGNCFEKVLTTDNLVR